MSIQQILTNLCEVHYAMVADDGLVQLVDGDDLVLSEDPSAFFGDHIEEVRKEVMTHGVERDSQVVVRGQQQREHYLDVQIGDRFWRAIAAPGRGPIPQLSKVVALHSLTGAHGAAEDGRHDLRFTKQGANGDGVLGVSVNRTFMGQSILVGEKYNFADGELLTGARTLDFALSPDYLRQFMALPPVSRVHVPTDKTGQEWLFDVRKQVALRTRFLQIADLMLTCGVNVFSGDQYRINGDTLMFEVRRNGDRTLKYSLRFMRGCLLLSGPDFTGMIRLEANEDRVINWPHAAERQIEARYGDSSHVRTEFVIAGFRSDHKIIMTGRPEQVRISQKTPLDGRNALQLMALLTLFNAAYYQFHLEPEAFLFPPYIPGNTPDV